MIADILDGPVPQTIPKPAQTTVLGIVVGELATTIAAVRYETELLYAGDAMFNELPVFETHYHLLNRDQMPAASYREIAYRVNTVTRRLYNRDDRGDYHVLVDASDVGRPVVDSIRDTILPQVHVTSVRLVTDPRGDLSILWRNDATVGLGYLVSRLRAIFQGHRLVIPPALAGIADALSAYALESEPSADLRALALCCASEYMAVRYDQSPDALPSAAW